MRIFVTGATGFIGSHLCRRLHQEGHQVVAMVRSAKKAQRLPEDTELLPGNLDSFKDEKFVIPPCDVVVHLAAALPGKVRGDYLESNLEGVQNLVACLQRQKWQPKCLLFTSSLAATGPSKLGQPHNETAPCQPVEEYGRSKLKAEEYLAGIDIPTISFRPPMVIGPNDEAVLDLFKMVKMGLGVRPKGLPQEVSFVAVADLVEAMVSAINNSENIQGHTPYFVSHPQVITNVELMQTMADIMGKKLRIVEVPKWLLYTGGQLLNGITGVFMVKNPLNESQYQMLAAEAFACNSNKLQEDTGWQPQQDLRAALQTAYDGYKKAGWL